MTAATNPDQTYQLPDLRYDYGAWSRTSPVGSWSCTTPNTTPPTSTGANRAIDRLQEARGSERLHGAVDAGEELRLQPVRPRPPLAVVGRASRLTAAATRRVAGRAARRRLRRVRPFRQHMIEAASTIQGSGWALASWEPTGRRVVIEQTYDHQGNHGQGRCPSWPSTPGSTRTTCSTRTTSARSSRRSGRSSTGLGRLPASTPPASPPRRLGHEWRPGRDHINRWQSGRAAGGGAEPWSDWGRSRWPGAAWPCCSRGHPGQDRAVRHHGRGPAIAVGPHRGPASSARFDCTRHALGAARLEVRVDELRLDDAERIARDPASLESLEDEIAGDARRALLLVGARSLVGRAARRGGRRLHRQSWLPVSSARRARRDCRGPGPRSASGPRQASTPSPSPSRPTRGC